MLSINLPKTFLMAYMEEVASSIPNWYEDNYDFHRFGPQTGQKKQARWKRLVIDFLRNKGYVSAAAISQTVFTAVKHIAPYISNFEWLYNKLADDQSRDILVKVLAFRTLGYRKVKLPLNTPAYWNNIKKMDQLADFTKKVSPDFLDFELYLMDLNKIGFPINLYFTPSGIHTQFVLEAYKCTAKETQIAVEPDDYVLDAGACWGDTALYFAHLAGHKGRVFSYEFVPKNLEILQKNIALNPNLGSTIDIIERAVWDKSDVLISYEANGPGSRIDASQQKNIRAEVRTLSIDDLVAQKNLSRLDFIKMDIEGAELPALHGAEATIKQLKPKLAISVYHKITDLFEIPEYLDMLGAGYKFFLRHFTIHAEETVLFAYTNK